MAGYRPLPNILSSPDIELHSPPGTPQRPTIVRHHTSSERYQTLRTRDQDIADVDHRDEISPVHGLGLRSTSQEHSPQLKRVPVGSREVIGASHQRTASEPVVAFSQSSTAHNTPYKEPIDEAAPWPSPQSSRLSLRYTETAYQHIPANVNLLQQTRPAGHACPTRGDILRSHWNWYCYAIIFLAVFSTIFSGIFLGIALRKPRWEGLPNLRIENATLLSALFSKLIELSFACVFVATLGQILSRKAFASRSRGQYGGVSIAEMNMRLWILQPGTLLTHWTGAWFALKTTLGIFVLLAAIAAALYITAAEVLVSPKLAFGKNETRGMIGKYTTQYANAAYLNVQCETPITKTVGVNDEEGRACMSIKHAGQGFKNFGTWTTTWGEKIHAAEDYDPPGYRPPPVAMMFDNTTVQGQWISPSKENITVDSQRYGRLVHNVTLAMPHANVVHAVRDPRNRILQPEDLRGDGEYYVKAAVPAPILNVLCVGLTDKELDPIILSTSTNYSVKTAVDDIFGFTANGTYGDIAPLFPIRPAPFNMILNDTKGYGQTAIYILSASPTTIQTAPYTLCGLRSQWYPNCTTTLHVAQAGSNLAVYCDYDSYNDTENSLPYSKFNPLTTVGTWSKDWPPIGLHWAQSTALSQGISASNASISRMLLQMMPQYSQGASTILNPRFPTLSEGLGVLAGNTLLIASDNTPFAHFWNHTLDHFDTPQDTRFASLLSYKDYTSGNSAPWQGVFYLVLFSVFLLNLFCLCYLLWKFNTDGEVTDYTEPQNLFALAINSPPSQIMSGSCGPGPDGDMLRKKWMVDIAMSTPKQHGHSPDPAVGMPGGTETTPSHTHSESHPHFYVRCPDDDFVHTPALSQHNAGAATGLRHRAPLQPGDRSDSPLYHPGPPPLLPGTARSSWLSRIGLGRYSPGLFGSLPKYSPGIGGLNPSEERSGRRSVNDTRREDWIVGESPAVEQYRRLTNHR